MIRTRNLHPDIPQRRNVYSLKIRNAGTVDLAGLALGVCTAKGGEKIKNVYLTQTIAGAGGTSVAVNVKKNGTTIFTTNPLLARTDGNDKSVDCLGEIAKPTGATRGVLAAGAASTLGQGDSLSVDLDYTGTYATTFPELVVTVLTEGV